MSKDNKKNTKHQYVKNAELIEALRTCKAEKAAGTEGSAKYKRAYDIVGLAMLLVAQNLIKRDNFSGYPKQIKQEMISDAIENVCLYIDNFDPDYVGPKSGQVNPFGYITQICWYAFIRRIAKEKKQLLIKAKMIQESGIINMIDTRQESDDRQYANEYLESLKSYQDYLEDSDFDKPEKSKKTKKKEGLEAVIAGEEIPQSLEQMKIDISVEEVDDTEHTE